jgi:hypothetical protein
MSTIICSIIDITGVEAAHSDAPKLHENAAQSRSEIVAARPPPPTKFNRRQAGTSSEAKPMQKSDRLDLSYIQAMRRHIGDQIYDSELCPVIGKLEQEDLWASLDDMFMQ